MPSVFGMVFSARTSGNLFELATRFSETMVTANSRVHAQVIEVARHKVLPCYHAVARCLSEMAPAANGKIAVVTVHDPIGTGVGDTSQSVIVHHLAGQKRTLLSYEPIVPRTYGLNGLKDRLAAHLGIQARIDHMAERLAHML